MIQLLSNAASFLSEEQGYKAPTMVTGCIGRPAVLVTKEQLEMMRRYGLKWIDIAKALGMLKQSRNILPINGKKQIVVNQC